MKTSYIAAILVAIGVVVIICAALLMTGESDDDSGDETFTVSFDTTGGSYVPSQNVQKNAKATEPVTSKDGYSFQGWYTSASGGSKFSFSQGITGNMTLYAQWSPLPSGTFVVTFDANGGTTVQSQTVKSGSYAIEPATSREGYTLTGWYTSATGGYKFNFSTPISGNITLYARWTINPEMKYTVTFDANGGAPSTSWTVKAGDCAYEPATPSRTGYSFAGWYTSATDGTVFDPSEPITADTKFYAHWEPVKYTVTFDANGGAPSTSQTVKYGECAKDPETPTRAGYLFTGWYTSASGGSVFDLSKPITERTTVYAHWNAPGYTVYFNANGGAPSTSQTVSSGGHALTPTTPTRAGYLFTGWYTSASGGSAFDFSTAITKNTTVYAHWSSSAIKTYTVTFDANGGAPSTSQTVAKGECASVPTVPTRAGYAFKGWYTSASGGSAFNFSTTITKNTTVYAHWDAYECVVTLVDFPGYIDDMETYTVNYGETFSHTVTHFGKDIGKDLGVSFTMYGDYQYSSGNGFTLTDMGPFWTKIEYGPVTSNVTIYYRFA